MAPHEAVSDVLDEAVHVDRAHRSAAKRVLMKEGDDHRAEQENGRVSGIR
jgi:hypothetical protein